MAIKNFVTGEVPYLISYQPYQLTAEQSECVLVDDMVSIDLQPNIAPTQIMYYVGAEQNYSTSINVKNITTNATLSVSMRFFEKLFIVTPTYLPNVMKFELEPQESQIITIELNKNSLDTFSEYEKFDIKLPLTIKNISNGTVVTKSTTVSLLEPTTLPSQVTVE